MSAATDNGERAERRLRELKAQFAERGRSLYVYELPGERWVACYPAPGQSIGSGPSEEGPTALGAALAAWTAYAGEGEASAD